MTKKIKRLQKKTNATQKAENGDVQKPEETITTNKTDNKILKKKLTRLEKKSNTTENSKDDRQKPEETVVNNKILKKKLKRLQKKTTKTEEKNNENIEQKSIATVLNNKDSITTSKVKNIKNNTQKSDETMTKNKQNNKKLKKKLKRLQKKTANTLENTIDVQKPENIVTSNKQNNKKNATNKLENSNGDVMKLKDNVVTYKQDNNEVLKKKLRRPQKNRLENTQANVQKLEETVFINKQDNKILKKKLKMLPKKATNVKSKNDKQKPEANTIIQNKRIGINLNKLKEKLLFGNTNTKTVVNSPSLPSPSNTLREKLQGKLKAARFRFINEQMYSNEGKDAQKLFESDPEAFDAYHNGYRQQVSKWPLNPVDTIITAINKIAKNKMIVDFGCGDAKLAQSVQHTVHSFDLVANNSYVTACDMARCPLIKHSVDVAVFCLSLMGTNLKDYLVEANRVLKIGGILKIAEVESRFQEVGVEQFIIVLQKFGFTNTWKDLSHNLFYFLDFKKERDIKHKNKLPTIRLNPCLYKKR